MLSFLTPSKCLSHSRIVSFPLLRSLINPETCLGGAVIFVNYQSGDKVPEHQMIHNQPCKNPPTDWPAPPLLRPSDYP